MLYIFVAYNCYKVHLPGSYMEISGIIDHLKTKLICLVIKKKVLFF